MLVVSAEWTYQGLPCAAAFKGVIGEGLLTNEGAFSHLRQRRDMASHARLPFRIAEYTRSMVAYDQMANTWSALKPATSTRNDASD